MHRVNEAVREVVGKAVMDDLEDPRIGFVTVTSADVRADLRSARIYVTVMGDEAQRKRSLDALNASHALVQARIAAELRMKNTPTLSFIYDESVDRGFRIDELLKKGEE